MSCSKKIASEKQMSKYANKNYGKATLVESEKTEEYLICHFTDNEYGFTYWVKSRIADFQMDGSVFFRFETKDSNFEEQYYYKLCEELQDSFEEMEQKYNINILIAEKKPWNNINRQALVKIIFQDFTEESVVEISKEVSQLFVEADTRKYWDQASIQMYDSYEKTLGRYGIGSQEYTSYEELELARFKLISLSHNQKAEFQYSETIEVEEFLEMVDIPIDKLDFQGHESVTLYYFSVNKGPVFYIANVLYSGDCYSNYREFYK